MINEVGRRGLRGIVLKGRGSGSIRIWEVNHLVRPLFVGRTTTTTSIIVRLTGTNLTSIPLVMGHVTTSTTTRPDDTQHRLPPSDMDRTLIPVQGIDASIRVRGIENDSILISPSNDVSSHMVVGTPSPPLGVRTFPPASPREGKYLGEP
jgi:hypothetical protein